MNTVRKLARKGSLVIAGVAGSAVAANAQTTPTALDGFKTTAEGYITAGTGVAVAAAVLSLGWVAFKIVRKYASKA